MKQLAYLLVLMLCSGLLSAQKGWERYAISKPCYRLEKISQALIDARKRSAVKVGSHGEGGFVYDELIVLPAAVYYHLSLREQFVYHIVHPEGYFQNCNGWSFNRRDSSVIFGNIPYNWGDGIWKENQHDFFKNNRDSVLFWIRSEIRGGDMIGLNFKKVLIELDAVEMIPDLLAVYDRQCIQQCRDNDICTTLLALMERGKYRPWLNSQLYRGFNDEKLITKSAVPWTKERELMIRRMAMAFYHEKHPDL